MFRRFTLFILLFLFSSSLTLADERTTIFEGLGATIERITDSMTDKQSGVIFLRIDVDAKIYMAIYDYNDFTIWANGNEVNFVPEENNLIRIGENPPFSLTTLTERNTLKPKNTTEAEAVIKGLAKGEIIKIRYVDWPHYNKFDKTIKNPNFAFLYATVAKEFGWKDFGIKPAPAELDVKTNAIYVVGNHNLFLTKRGIGYNDEAHNFTGEAWYIFLYDSGELSGNLFGIQRGEWCCDMVDRSGKTKIIIRNSQNDIVFTGITPLNNPYSSLSDCNPWPIGEKVAKAAWDSAPLGTIEIEGPMYGNIKHGKAFLYGFRELWKWGIENAGFPSLESK